ncbi:amidohydrolase [Lysobacter soyae]|uniref:Amidohydrolase n=1 Tax=Lysobacter soyae TaxID=2764185 RepID=A0ABX8WNZ5_9GAMM|nr:amidohydrolase [Lysobacter sp. CJ11]QYR52189.1 amidohydrolase [Lysobacter sp. CJ11]
MTDASDLRIHLVQGNTRWHDPDGNRHYYQGMIEPLKGKSDLVVLPETFTSGFSNDAVRNAEDMHGKTVAWMRAQAAELDAAVCGSVQMSEAGKVFNRMLFVTPDGGVQTYDKRHLFTFAREHERYSAGVERLIVKWRGWRICPLVCYDLRFPVFSRNGLDAGDEAHYDLLLYVANWPSVRDYPWRTLLRARAIENLSYVAGVNRVGDDGNGLHYSGDSAVIDFLGQPMIELRDAEGVIDAVLDPSELRAHRTRFPALNDADGYSLV